MVLNLSGKTAFITGGGSGIGAGFAEGFVKAGAKVVLADANLAGAEEVAARLNKGDKVALAVKCDVTNYGSLLKAFQAGRNQSFNASGRIDYVFANAGVMDKNGYGDFKGTLEELDAKGEAGAPNLFCQQVNADGPILTAWLAVAHFRNQEIDENGWRGKLIMAASEASFIPFPADILYSSSKASTLWLSRSWAAKLLHENITVNSYAPNQIKTNIAGNHPGIWDDAEKRGALSPISFLVDRVMETLVDPKSKLTGQSLAVCAEEWGLRGHGKFFNEKAQQNATAYTDFDEIFEAFKIPDGIPSVPH